MILIIDGYNVLKQAMRTTHIKEQQKSNFLRQLDLYARTKKHDIIVVFDGGEQGAAYKEYRGSVLIMYSGARESADEVIVRQVESLKDKELLLISSDRELRRKAAMSSVDSLPAHDFYDLLTGVREKSDTQKKKAGPFVKTSKNDNEELDRLILQESQSILPKTEDLKRRESIVDTKATSKTEKKLLKKVKKL